MALLPRTQGELSSGICDEKRWGKNEYKKCPHPLALVEKPLWLTEVE